MKTPLDTLQSIRNRRTVKVISETPLPITPRDEDLINTLIESAYYAPFHYPCHNCYRQAQDSPLPWRFYVLDSQACRQLEQRFQQADKRMGKISQMLNSADYLIQATWCPQPQKDGEQSDELFVGNLVNMEHLAAAGAAIQNLLLTATALGHENYWSSGGILREAFTYQQMGINEAEILLGSLFLFPSEADAPPTTNYLLGKRHGQRGQVDDCYRFVNIDHI